jgi:hypothetical protein
MRVCEIQIGARRGEANKRNEPKCSLIDSVDLSTTNATSTTSTTRVLNDSFVTVYIICDDVLCTEQRIHDAQCEVWLCADGLK